MHANAHNTGIEYNPETGGFDVVVNPYDDINIKPNTNGILIDGRPVDEYLMTTGDEMFSITNNFVYDGWLRDSNYLFFA